MKFKVGDKVKIKSWDKMVKEFGVDYDGDIETRPYFVKEMKKFCGKTVTIASITNNWFKIKESKEYSFSEHMVETEASTAFKVGDKVRILDGSKINNYTGKWTPLMEEYVGKIATIRSVVHFHRGTGYRVNEFHYTWDERGLELVNNQKIVITSKGKTTTAKLYEGNNLVKTSEAKCCPSDEFDFETGAKIAFERLFEKKIESQFKPGDKAKIIADSNCHCFKIGTIVTLEEHWRTDSEGVKIWTIEDSPMFIKESDIAICNTYNGKVVCINNCNNSDNYTVGKIYQFVDGVITTDRGAHIHGFTGGFESFEQFADWTTSKFIEVKE